MKNIIEIKKTITIGDVILEAGDKIRVFTEEKMKVECMECGNIFSTSNFIEPKCPKCGSYDIDVV